jgi:acyl-coenzyme A synthetase/AMP-(fatty) acid ligase
MFILPVSLGVAPCLRRSCPAAPKKFYVRDELPKNSVGKVQRRALKEMPAAGV